MDGRYRVLEIIGRGGMGEVYRVEHVRIPKVAAMKLLHPELAREAEVVARFQREAKAVSKLSHPHTVQVFDFGEHDHALFLVMEFVKGRDLGSLCRELGPMPYQRVLPMIIQICLALEEAHELGVVHRDIKPENVLVTQGTDDADYVKVLDFGLAQLRESKDQANITQKGNVIGTPYYMAPEQIRGEEVDHRVDIYAIGATMYRMITGVVPFPAKTPVGVLTKCLTEALEPPCKRRPDLNIPGELEAVIMRAMAKEPSERFATVRGLRKALQACLASLTTQPVRVLGAGTGDPWAQSSFPGLAVATSPFRSENNLRREDLDHFERRFRWRRRLAVLIPVLILLLAGGGVAAWLLRPPPKQAALDREHEPNNTTSEANLIVPWRPVRGQIGKRISETQSDVDAYEFRIQSKGLVVFSARLTGIPYINTSLQIYSEEGREIVAVDNGPARTDEVLPNQILSPGRYFAVVQEVAGKVPGTNVNDWYKLSVRWRTLRADEEVEPNDSLEAANRIRSQETVKGFLSRVDDVDMFRPVGSGGDSLNVTLMGAKGQDLRLRVVGLERGVSASRAASLQVVGQLRRVAWTRLADQAGPGGSEHLRGLIWRAGAPAPLIIVEPGSHQAPDPGRLDQPYWLQVTVHSLGGTKGGAPRAPSKRAAPVGRALGSARGSRAVAPVRPGARWTRPTPRATSRLAPAKGAPRPARVAPARLRPAPMEARPIAGRPVAARRAAVRRASARPVRLAPRPRPPVPPRRVAVPRSRPR